MTPACMPMEIRSFYHLQATPVKEIFELYYIFARNCFGIADVETWVVIPGSLVLSKGIMDGFTRVLVSLPFQAGPYNGDMCTMEEAGKYT